MAGWKGNLASMTQLEADLGEVTVDISLHFLKG